MLKRLKSGSDPTTGACVIPCPDYRWGMFFLTWREQMVMIIILIALVLGSAVRHFRVTTMLPSQVVHAPSTQ